MTDAFYGPRSRVNAAALLASAAAVGLDPRVVRTAPNGYLVPEEVLSHLNGLSDIKEGVTYPAPERPRGNYGREKWAEYARLRGLEVADEDTRDDLIAKVDALDEKEND